MGRWILSRLLVVTDILDDLEVRSQALAAVACDVWVDSKRLLVMYGSILTRVITGGWGGHCGGRRLAPG